MKYIMVILCLILCSCSSSNSEPTKTSFKIKRNKTIYDIYCINNHIYADVSAKVYSLVPLFDDDGKPVKCNNMETYDVGRKDRVIDSVRGN